MFGWFKKKPYIPEFKIGDICIEINRYNCQFVIRNIIDDFYIVSGRGSSSLETRAIRDFDKKNLLLERSKQ